mgnify:CR=1 FL=1
MKKRTASSLVKYIAKQLESCSAVSIHLGEYSDQEISKLHHHFKITKDFFGYHKFTKRTS